MCGIWAILYKTAQDRDSWKGTGYTKKEVARRLEMTVDELRVMNHSMMWSSGVDVLESRGPEGYKFMDIEDEGGSEGEAESGTFAFTRLAINGLNDAGMQPFVSKDCVWMCNGEIYNSASLGVSESGSDCEVLGSLWSRCERDAISFSRALDGVFSIILYDKVSKKFVIARDPYGIRPLFYINGDRQYIFASERKALEPFCKKGDTIDEFPPGEVWTIDSSSLAIEKNVYHTVPWLKNPTVTLANLRDCLTLAVSKRLLTERPVASLLSGGVDSSLISALVQKMLKDAGKPPLKTFSIGMKGGTDLIYAKKVAEWIGSDHTEVVVTADEMFNVIPEVIRDIESYDITTVRASVGNWMIAREIRKHTDCKVVFNGDGSDEIFGSYMYFYKAPNGHAFERETERLLKEINCYDVLRSDRSISSHGLEARTPFLDKQFVSVARSFPTELRMPMRASADEAGAVEGRVEKQILREAFSGQGLLPDEVLWRRKEAFSDGVSSVEKSWFMEIQDRIKDRGLVPENWEKLSEDLPVKPITQEAYYYRMLFESMYPHTGKKWPFWMPRWSPDTSDPSARTLNVY